MKMYLIEVFIWTFAIFGFIKFISEFWLDFSMNVFNLIKLFIKVLTPANNNTRKV